MLRTVIFCTNHPLPSQHEDAVLLFFMLLGAQIVLRLVSMFVVFMLMSGTFVFRYGLLGVLLNRFKTLLIIMPVAFLVTTAYRVYRLVLVLGNETVVSIWDDSLYQALYALNTGVSVVYYAAVGLGAFRVGDRDLYQPSAWLR